MDDTRGTPHWRLLLQLRRHQPVRPDRLAEVWWTFLESHDDDVAAALGALVAHVVAQGLLDEHRRRSA